MSSNVCTLCNGGATCRKGIPYGKPEISKCAHCEKAWYCSRQHKKSHEAICPSLNKTDTTEVPQVKAYRISAGIATETKVTLWKLPSEKHYSAEHYFVPKLHKHFNADIDNDLLFSDEKETFDSAIEVWYSLSATKETRYRDAIILVYAKDKVYEYDNARKLDRDRVLRQNKHCLDESEAA